MVGGGEDLGLSLSLGSVENHHHQQQHPQQQQHYHHHHPQLELHRFPAMELNLIPSTSTHQQKPQQQLHHHQQKTQWNDLLASSSERRGSPEQPRLRGIDVNRAPAAERESEEEAGASSPNSTLSSVSGKRDLAQMMNIGDGVAADESSRGISDEEDGDGSRKKLRLSKDQSAVLEESFKEHNTLNPKQKLALAKQLNLRPRQVEVWFQNRRARTKLKQTEVDCEFLKRCCENLTDENRRLQKEVAELRALKLSPQFYMHMTPPTTLTMCPSCERVAVGGNASNGNASKPAAANPSSFHPAAAAPQPELHFLPHHHRPAPAAPPAPWAPVPIRASFVDVHPQRS